MTIAHPAHEPTTRTERALELYRTRAGEIEEIAPDIYLVPSQDGTRVYRVQYGESEYCSCPDHSYRAVNCVHILAVGIYHAKHCIRPEVAAGDPFLAAGRPECPVCYRGVVYLTYEEDGHEWTEPAPCRKCAGR